MTAEHQEALESFEALLCASEAPLPLVGLANTAAWVWQTLPEINWAGFYLLHRGSLWLGPFQGKPACTCIQPGRGVCGTALQRNETIIVPDVHLFPGHIACDATSRSELVIPIRVDGKPIGVLDIDSPYPGRFTESDSRLLEAAVRLLETRCDWAQCGYDLNL